MLADLADRFEWIALRASPAGAAQAMGAAPTRLLDAVQRARFRRTLRLAAMQSPFYRDAFRERGIRVETISHPSELGDFYTTGEDLRTHGHERFCTGRGDTAFETTGTTSALPKRVVFSTREVNAMGMVSAAALRLLGLCAGDSVLSAFDCSFWVSPAVTRSALQYIGCFHVEGGKIDPAECYDRGKAYRPTVIFGEPSWLVRFSELAAERGAWPIKMLVAGGENMAEAARQHVEEVWGAPLYMNYGQTEAFGSLGLECRQQAGYHRNDLQFLFEIDRPAEDGYGELIYTTLTRDVMPLIRYRASDITRMIDAPCACGLFARRLARIRSRADEMVVCGMGNVGPWVVDEWVRGIDGIGPDWQLAVDTNDRYDVLTLTLELPQEAPFEAVRAAVLGNLRTRFPDFWKNLQLQLYELRVERAASGSLRSSRKLLRIVDRRGAAGAMAAPHSVRG